MPEILTLSALTHALPVFAATARPPTFQLAIKLLMQPTGKSNWPLFTGAAD